MKAKFASLLALLLALTFVAVLVSQVAATDSGDKEKAVQEQADQKIEVKGMVEEAAGKTTVDVKELKPVGDPTEEAAETEKPE